MMNQHASQGGSFHICIQRQVLLIYGSNVYHVDGICTDFNFIDNTFLSDSVNYKENLYQ